MAQSTRSPGLPQYQRAQRAFLSAPQTSFSELLPPEWFDQLQAQSDYHQRVYTPQVTLQAFIEQCLSADGSCQQAVARVMADRVGQGQKANSLNTGPYCKARQRLALPLLEQAVRLSGEALEEQLPEPWRWNGYRVKIVDGTTLQMPDTEANQDAFPQSTSQKPGLGFPRLRAVAVMSLASGAVVDYAYGPYAGKYTGEMSLLEKCVEAFQAGDLLLGDSYYCTWALLAYMHLREVPVLVEHHAARFKLDWRRGQRLGHKDRLIEWKRPPHTPRWLSRQQYLALPESISVRLVQRKGKVFLTTLLDKNRFPKAAISGLYSQRWEAEVDLRTLKQGLGLGQLRCLSPSMIGREIAVTFLAYNMIRALIAQAAWAHQRRPRHLSFQAAVNVLSAFRSSWVKASASVFQALLHAIASVAVGQRKRPSQPRAVKRRPKQYPRLMIPRLEACQNLINSWA